MRDEFSQKTKQRLAERVGYHCSKCWCPTSGPGADESVSINIGEASHICAAAEGGPRYDTNMSPEDRRSIDNGIWLCRNCAHLIDGDEKKFTKEKLQKMKKHAEERAKKELGKGVGEKETLNGHDLEIVDLISSCLEGDNERYMLSEHDFHEDFYRKHLDPIFELINDLKKPSNCINNKTLKKKIEELICNMVALRTVISLEGGPTEYDPKKYSTIDSEAGIIKTNKICRNIWENYKNLMLYVKG